MNTTGSFVRIANDLEILLMEQKNDEEFVRSFDETIDESFEEFKEILLNINNKTRKREKKEKFIDNSTQPISTFQQNLCTSRPPPKPLVVCRRVPQPSTARKSQPISKHKVLGYGANYNPSPCVKEQTSRLARYQRNTGIKTVNFAQQREQSSPFVAKGALIEVIDTTIPYYPGSHRPPYRVKRTLSSTIHFENVN